MPRPASFCSTWAMTTSFGFTAPSTPSGRVLRACGLYGLLGRSGAHIQGGSEAAPAVAARRRQPYVPLRPGGLDTDSNAVWRLIPMMMLSNLRVASTLCAVGAVLL